MIWLLFLALALLPSSVEATARFMSENGATSGTCATSGTACRFDRVVAVAACGDTVTILNGDGTYTGANNMINTDASFGGTTPANPICEGPSGNGTITFSAETDGGVFFDGENSRAPFIAKGLTYWVFEGFDAGNADVAGTNFVLAISDLDHVTMRRICLSNVQLTSSWHNTHIFSTYGAGIDNSTFEDFCVFGTGRTAITESTVGNGNIFRRFWIRWEGWCPPSPGGDAGSYGFQGSYYEDLPAPTTHGDAFYENIIVIWDPEQQTRIPCDSDGGARIPFLMRTPSTPIAVRGLIVYQYSGLNTVGVTASTHPFVYDNHSTTAGSYERTYVDVFVDRRDATADPFGTALPINLRCISGSLCNNNTADRLTALRASSTPASSFTGWTVTNGPPTNECTSPSSCPNFYTGDSPGTGARNCFRYSSGTLTSTPLWPWPMDDRIKAALARANAAGLGGSALAGTAGTGYAANTVTSEIVSRYGSVPSACLSGSAFTPSFPVASDFPSVAVIDNFDRADSASLGANWTRTSGSDDFSIVSNQAVAGATFDRTLYTGSQITASHEVYATLVTRQAAGLGDYITILTFAGEAAADNPQYRVRINRQSGANTLIKVEKYDSGGSVAATPIPATDLGTEIADGNSFGVRVSGTTLSLYWKWSDGIWYRVDQVTDATLPTGMVYGGIGGLSPMVINDFGAGPTSGTPEPPNPPGTSSGAGRFGTTFPGVR